MCTTNPCQEKKASKELDLEMTQMLELSDRELQVTIIHIVKDLQEKVDNTHSQMGI